MNSEKKTKLIKALRIALSVFWWCLLVLLFLLLVNIFSAKMQGKVPSAFGYSVLNIVSGSMEDEIPEGSYILVKKVEPEEVKKNDVICFYSSDPTIYGMPNTHRVVEEPIYKDGKLEFVTKGDANPQKDKVTAKGDRLIGVYVDTLDTLTAFTNSLNSGTMLVIFIGLQVCIAGMIVYSVIIVRKHKKEDGQTPSDKE